MSLLTLVRTSRPLFWLNTAAMFVLALIVRGGPLSMFDVALVLYFTFPFNLWLHGINDIYDYESDRRNPRKGSAEGALLPPGYHAQLWRWILGVNLPFVLLALLRGPWLSSALLLLFLFLGWAYSAPPIRGKSRPFLDSAINTAYILPLLIGLALASIPPQTWPWAGVLAFALWSMASHAFTSIQDIEADQEAGIQTIATFLGAQTTAWVALLTYVGVALLAGGYGWPWGLLVSSYAIMVAWYMLAPSRERAHTLYRLFILANSTVGFLVITTLALANPTTTLWAAILVLSLVALVVGMLRWTHHPAPPLE